jgi:hypothetical protein
MALNSTEHRLSVWFDPDYAVARLTSPYAVINNLVALKLARKRQLQIAT